MTPSPMCGLGKPSSISSHCFLKVKDDLSSQYYTQRPHFPTTQKQARGLPWPAVTRDPGCAPAGHHGQQQTQCLMPGLFLLQGHRLLRTMACFTLPIPVLPLGPGCVCAPIALPESGSTLPGRRPGDPQAKGLWVWDSKSLLVGS